MAKTKEDNRKLLSCSFNFYVPKLIIFILVLFISINSDNGEKVHSKGGNGVSTVNVSTTSYQLFNGEATAIYADAPSGDIAIANKQNNHTGHGEGTTEAHYNFIVNENRDATRVDDADDADDADDSVGDGHRNTTSRRKNRSYNSNGERVLSRRRRYLIFPEGSSLQVVFDLVVPIVDYDHYIILGMTAAMAWELPFEPVDLEELQEQYEEGHLPLLERSDNLTSLLSNTATSSKKKSSSKKKKQPTKASVDQTSNPNSSNDLNSNFNQQYDGSNSNLYNGYQNYMQSMRPATYSQPHPYYTNYDNDKSSPSSLDRYYATANRSPYRPAVGTHRPPLPSYSNKMEYYLSYADQFFKEIDAQMNSGQPTTTATKAPKKSKTKTIGAKRKSDVKISGGNSKQFSKNLKPKKTTLYGGRKHLIHPIFKRNINWENIHPVDKFDLAHHRKTRHILYEQIEKFLEAQGNPGMECILKTLCETGQRNSDDEPGSMVVELLRAVFTLPPTSNETEIPIHRRYDEAHGTDQNCIQLFPRCKGSIWKSKFNE